MVDLFKWTVQAFMQDNIIACPECCGRYNSHTYKPVDKTQDVHYFYVKSTLNLRGTPTFKA